MVLVVLNVASPFAPVGPGAAGDAEKVVAQLDAALVRDGQESIVMACEGSVADGILLATGRPSAAPAENERSKILEQWRFTLQKFLARWPIDLIHMHGADFYEYLPPPGITVLVTLHRRADEYPEQVFHLQRPQTFLHCVSASQRDSCPKCASLLPEVENYFSVYERLVSESRAGEAAALRTTGSSAFAT